MTIKIEKETEVNLDSAKGELGAEITWYWVRAYDKDVKFPIVQKVCRSEEDANKIYKGLAAYYEKNGTIEPKTEILSIHEIE